MSLSGVLDKHPTVEQRLKARRVCVTVLVADSLSLLQGAAEDPECIEVSAELVDTTTPSHQSESPPLPHFPYDQPPYMRHKRWSFFN